MSPLYNYVPDAVDDNDENSISVYPNPAFNYLYVSLDNPNSEKCSIEIFDESGRRIRKFDYNLEEDFFIDVSSFTSGSYFIRINDGENKIIKKFNVLK
ncbi:MAG: T9SS type A sorting domain-containing protein [Saprospiraceae bacterium]